MEAQLYIECGQISPAINILLTMRENEEEDESYFLRYQRKNYEDCIVQGYGRLHYVEDSVIMPYNLWRLLQLYIKACIQLGDSINPQIYTVEDANKCHQLIQYVGNMRNNPRDQASIQSMYQILCDFEAESNGCTVLIAAFILRYTVLHVAHKASVPDEILQRVDAFEQHLHPMQLGGMRMDVSGRF